MSKGYQKGGFDHRRYNITKTNGRPVDPNAEYFVLRYDADPHAMRALATYAESVSTDNPKLAQGILQSLFHHVVNDAGAQSFWARAAHHLLYRLAPDPNTEKLREHVQALENAQEPNP